MAHFKFILFTFFYFYRKYSTHSIDMFKFISLELLKTIYLIIIANKSVKKK